MPNPFDRRTFFTRGLTTASALALTLEGRADPENAAEDPTHYDLVTPEVVKAVERGLAFLSTTQNRDGSFGTGSYAGNIAVTALSGLALLAGGHQPGRGAYGQSISRAVAYILSQEQRTPRGFLYYGGGMIREGPMYSHGFGLLFLAETFGMIGDARLQSQLKGTIERAIKVIVDSQNSEGGWRYEPTKQIADTSVTICQIMALRACRNAGFYVPKSTVDQCTKYIRSCQLADGGFSYFASPGKAEFPRSAAGVVALFCAGIYEGEEIRRGLNYLSNYRPGGNARSFLPDKWYYYGQYYAAQAMWTAGGRYWTDWFPAIRDELLNKSRQRGDGIWNDGSVGSHYSTAMACIILQIPNNYLPILQK